ncbi:MULTISPECIES: helix-turn-helix domain-containing protein [unclassified Rhizobium]|uniref:helix-turn-helix domain-containing protein n=1 Tax=unclassified Rhizobium TaxID=2613769 RepID=UPI0007C83498|nr:MULTISPECIES: helix-turn-helix domain-containing protein [unclassified Rhizobium]MBN8954486.1 helix-turn-helix domain-containing protein [Rhizobium tropici]OJY66728.1 MAG: hypothetical protein BGP09_32380 [Rhizobium sp. 60-20]
MRIRRARTTLGWSQSRLGSAVGVSFQQIQKYESGNSAVGASRLISLSKALNVPVSFLLQDEQQTVQPPDNAAFPECSPQSADLFQAFLAIGDPRVRSKIVELLQLIALISSSTLPRRD